MPLRLFLPRVPVLYPYCERAPFACCAQPASTYPSTSKSYIKNSSERRRSPPPTCGKLHRVATLRQEELFAFSSPWVDGSARAGRSARERLRYAISVHPIVPRMCHDIIAG